MDKGIDRLTISIAIESGTLGTIILEDLRMKWHRAQSYCDDSWPLDWRSNHSTEGGSAANQGMYSINQLQQRWRLSRDIAEHYNHQIETEDCGVVILTFESDAFGVIQARKLRILQFVILKLIQIFQTKHYRRYGWCHC
ncbi:MAG: Gfo/Idh/MocA family oxidoreductase [Candidatus Poribacteria bacterium]